MPSDLLHNRALIFALTCSCLALPMSACDQDVGPRDDRTEALVAAIGTQSGLDASAATELQAPLSALMQSCSHVEVFSFRTTHDSFLVNSAPGGLFSPMPSDIELFQAPNLGNAFIAGFEFRDLQGHIVGMGTEQEVLDLPNFSVDTTYTLTIPGRGTLMLGQQEGLEEFLGEIDDMMASQEYVRTFNPPLVMVNTTPGTGHIIGGTGEFAGSRGTAIEVGFVYSIDLIEQSFDLGVALLIGFE